MALKGQRITLSFLRHCCLAFVEGIGVRFITIRNLVWNTGNVDTKIQIYPCKHLPPDNGGFFA